MQHRSTKEDPVDVRSMPGTLHCFSFDIICKLFKDTCQDRLYVTIQLFTLLITKINLSMINYYINFKEKITFCHLMLISLKRLIQAKSGAFSRSWEYTLFAVSCHFLTFNNLCLYWE